MVGFDGCNVIVFCLRLPFNSKFAYHFISQKEKGMIFDLISYFVHVQTSFNIIVDCYF